MTMQLKDGNLVHHVEVFAVGGGEQEPLQKEMNNQIAQCLLIELTVEE